MIHPRRPQPRQASAQEPPAAAPRRSLQERASLERPVLGSSQTSVEQDTETLAMSTLSFQDYVRERMLRKRRELMGTDKPATAQAQAPQQRPLAESVQVPQRHALQPARPTAPPASRRRRPWPPRPTCPKTWCARSPPSKTKSYVAPFPTPPA